MGLDRLYAEAGPALMSRRRAAYGNAYLALGMLSDQAQDWASARKYMRNAIKINPALLKSYGVVRRLIKLHLGRNLVTAIKLRS
jgi:hypothetical protein